MPRVRHTRRGATDVRATAGIGRPMCGHRGLCDTDAGQRLFAAAAAVRVSDALRADGGRCMCAGSGRRVPDGRAVCAGEFGVQCDERTVRVPAGFRECGREVPEGR